MVLNGRELLLSPLVLAALMTALTSTVYIAWQLNVENKKKDQIKAVFGTSVSPALVEQMVRSGKQPQLGGHEAEITAFFSSVQSFSANSESLPPYRLIELMNEYLKYRGGCASFSFSAYRESQNDQTGYAVECHWQT